MAINILEAARLAANNGEYKKAGVLQTFAQQSMLLSAIPTPTINGNSYSWTREAVLPTVSFRQINEGYTEDVGATEKLTETLKAVGGDLDVDNYHVETGGSQIRTTHEMMKAKSLAQQIGYTLIKGAVIGGGNLSVSNETFDGLQIRYGGGAGGSGGAAVDTSGVNGGQLLANDASGAALSIAKLDEAIQKVDNPTHLLMAKKMRINITSLLRNSASISTGRDEFGRLVQTYNGIPILDADQNGDLAGLAFDEYDGSSDVNTSIYCLDLSESGLHMIQSPAGVSVRDLGEQESKPVWRTRVEWYCGLVDEMPRCVSRLYNITDATAVA